MVAPDSRAALNDLVVTDDSIRAVVPFEPMPYAEAVRIALEEAGRP